MSLLLGISKDGAYRRLRGNTDLSLADSIILAKHFGISLNIIGNNEDGEVCGIKDRPIHNIRDFRRQFENIELTLEEFQQYSGTRLMIEAMEVPLFRQFRYPGLAAFKIFIWLKSVFNLPDFEALSFGVSKVPSDLLDSAQRIANSYNHLDSLEFWSANSFKSLVRQVEYYHDAGLFSKAEEQTLILKELRNLVSDLKKEVLSGRKVNLLSTPAKGKMRLYYHEYLPQTPQILFERAGVAEELWMSFEELTFIKSKTQDLLSQKQKSNHLKMKNSLLISSNEEKERSKFFFQLERELQALENRLLSSAPL